jgi:hypothetical protein
MYVNIAFIATAFEEHQVASDSVQVSTTYLAQLIYIRHHVVKLSCLMQMYIPHS